MPRVKSAYETDVAPPYRYEYPPSQPANQPQEQAQSHGHMRTARLASAPVLPACPVDDDALPCVPPCSLTDGQAGQQRREPKCEDGLEPVPRHRPLHGS